MLARLVSGSGYPLLDESLDLGACLNLDVSGAHGQVFPRRAAFKDDLGAT
jgi:hypothetical protein